MLINKFFTLMQILALAFVYLLSSQLCSLVGAPSEFGSVIWPPAGISLACLVIFGSRLWLGVLIGAFLANLYFIFNLANTLTSLSYITASIEAVGATLEALAGVWLMKNLAHFPNPLHTEKQIGLFVVCAFLSCFISPTVAMATLMLTHQIPLNVAESHWIDWYLGDFIGMLIFTPLILIWLHRSLYFAGRRLAVTASVLAALMLTVLLVSYEFDEERTRLRIEFEKDTQGVNAAVEKQLSGHFNSLNAAASLYNSTEEVNRREFGSFVRHLFHVFKGIQALEFSEVVTNSQRHEFESAIRKEGFSNFYITERDKDKNFIPAGQRDRYVVVNFVEPMKGNEKIFGFDTLSDASRKQTFNQAIDSGKLTFTPKLTLVQEHGTQSGVLAILPVYRNNMAHNTVEEKRANIQGFIVGVFRIGDMLDAALREINHENLAIQLFDTSSYDEPVVLFETQDVLERSLNVTNAFNMPLGDRVWQMKISATKAYLENHDELSANHIHSNFAWHILLMGLIITSLIGSATLIITGRKMLLEDLIKIRTAELAKSEENFRTMADATPVLIWQADRDAICFWFNQVWLDFVGRSLEEEVGEGWLDGVHPEDIEHCFDIYHINFNLRLPFKIEYRLRHHSGDYRWILDTGIPRFNALGDFDGYIGSCIDISEFKHTQQIMNEAKEAAEVLAQSKTDFLANMSHEIRTPMNAIIGLSQLALNVPANRQSDYLEKILGASETLLDILNDILDFSKLDSNAIKMEYASFNLDDLLNNLHNLFSVTARQKNIKFILDIDPLIRRELMGDALRLQQVLTNLLNNSFKFTQLGMVQLIVTLAHQENEKIALTFAVIDTGIGMNEAQQKGLFQAFSQADTSISRRFGGSGLGLVISQKFVELMGGKITCQSMPDLGSEFSFTVPFDIANSGKGSEAIMPRPPKKTLAQRLAEATESLENVRVLLVEDTPLNQQVASEFLRNAKLEVTVADNGQAALELLEHNTFEVILMDIQMPVMDGLEATKMIRENPKVSHLPIIAMSAGVTLDEQEKCQLVGMSDFIPKPINPVQMLEKIKQNLIPPSNV
ncbi:MAG: CHASE domain-containing protein [Methylococcaceae bacterium]